MRKIGLRRRGVSVVAFLMAGTLFAGLPALADPHDRLERIRQKKERVEQQRQAAAARGETLSKKIQHLDALRASVAGRVHNLDTKISSLDQRIEVVKDNLEKQQIKLAVETDELQGILSRLEHRSNLLKERARAAYIAGPTAYFDSLLSSETFNDLVQRSSYYESAMESDSELITEIEVLRDESETRRDNIIRKEHQVVVAKQKLEKDRAEIAQARAKQAQALERREAVLSQKHDLLREVNSNIATYRALEDQLDQNSDEVAALIRQQEAAAAATQIGSPSTSVAVSSGGGQLLWPANGPVTSGYGWRTHPIYGDRRLHTGIDIGAPYGSAVVAADNGTVTFVGVMSGYGNVVIVDHGGGLATTYNHLSAFLVGEGQSVGRGEQIAEVGCTGYCTGPHLHFEVRVNGTPVDPMPYLQ
jgi:murein DD-endopeptidase MepM/ murein hydrolase activator NlpD